MLFELPSELAGVRDTSPSPTGRHRSHRFILGSNVLEDRVSGDPTHEAEDTNERNAARKRQVVDYRQPYGEVHDA